MRRVSVCLVIVTTLLLAFLPAGASEQNQLAILNLRPTNFEAMGYNGEVLYSLISALEKEKQVQLMPRRAMEDKLSQAGLVQGDTPEMAMEAGKVLGIRFVLFGNVTKKGGRILASLQLMDMAQRRVVRAWEENYGSREDIISRMPGFAQDLAKALTGTEVAATREPARPTFGVADFRAVSKGDHVKIQWAVEASAPVSAFHVYRSEAVDGPFQFVGKTDKNDFLDTTVRKGRNYFYRLGFLMASGQEIKYDQTAEIRNVGEPIPHPPLILGATGYVRRAEIRFVPNLLNDQENFQIIEYRIHRRTGLQSEWTLLDTAGAKMTSQSELGFSFEDTQNLEDGRLYQYAISSLDQKKRESPFSDPVQVTVVGVPLLRLEKENLLRKVALSWDPISQAEGYYLYRKADPEAFKRVQKIRSNSAFPFVDEDGLEDGRRYEYYLTAYDAKGETGASNTVQAKTKEVPPYPADIIVRSGMVKAVEVSWTASEDPDVGGYNVYRGTDSEELKSIAKVRGYESTSYMDKGSGFSSLEDGTDYYYQVAAYNLFGAEGPRTPAAKARTKPRPQKAGGIRLSALADRILLQWDPNPEPDIKAYVLYRSRNAGGWSKLTEAGAGDTAFTDTDLKPDSEYRYRIVVQDADGLESDPAESQPVASPLAKPAS